jgi:hypothetical protein
MKKLSPYLAVSAITLAGCGGQVTENQPGEIYPEDTTTIDAGNTDSAVDTDAEVVEQDAGTDSVITNTRFLTRAQFAHDLVGFLGYGGNYDAQLCTPAAGDIEPDTTLCVDVNILQHRGIMPNFTPSNEFYPDMVISNEEVWKYIVQALNWTPVLADCVTNNFRDYEEGRWSNAYAGALCEKGIPIGQADGTLSSNLNTDIIDYWNSLKSGLDIYLNAATTRADIAEIVGRTMLGLSPDPDVPFTCDSTTFTDIPSDSLTCYYVQQLVSLGYISTAPNTYRPDDSVNSAEISKIFSETLGLTQECTGCSNTDCANWYAGYVDSICELHYRMPEPSATLPRFQLSYMAPDIKELATEQ